MKFIAVALLVVLAIGTLRLSMVLGSNHGDEFVALAGIVASAVYILVAVWILAAL